jgi:murein DD-endopeptidase MepM/ murein hydrolase activator NlpD
VSSTSIATLLASHTTRRAVIAAIAAVAIALAPTPGGTVAACWLPPVSAPVSDPFRPPDCRWCPGNRGLEYDTAPGQRVRAVATGRVTFAGEIAGTVYVVTELGDGRRVTYGRLATRLHEAGEIVLRGQIVGTTGEGFHFGVRVAGDYVDPAPSIGRLVGRPRLLPSDGSPAAPAPPPSLRCGDGSDDTDPRRRDPRMAR